MIVGAVEGHGGRAFPLPWRPHIGGGGTERKGGRVTMAAGCWPIGSPNAHAVLLPPAGDAACRANNSVLTLRSSSITAVASITKAASRRAAAKAQRGPTNRRF